MTIFKMLAIQLVPPFFNKETINLCFYTDLLKMRELTNIFLRENDVYMRK